MKKLIIASSISLILAAPTNQLLAEDNKTEESIGFGSGLVIGAIAGGPIGAIFGAAAGAWLGDKVNESDKVPELHAQLDQKAFEAQTIKQSYQDLEVAHNNAQVQLQQQEAYKAKVSQSKQLITGIQIDLMFRSNSSELDPMARGKLTPVILMLEHFPELALQLTGHGDIVGSKAKNKLVAQKRSEAVLEQLVAAGIDPRRVQINALGKDQAQAQLHDVEGRALDRRVRLAFVQADPATITVAQN